MKTIPLLAIAAIVLSPLGARAQKDTAHHRSVYAEINESQKSLHYSKASVEDEHAEVKVEGWDDDGYLRKMVATIAGEHGTGVEEYYLEDGEPLFVYSKYDTVNMQTGKVVAVVEDRFYFKDGAMFKWLGNDKQPVDPGSADFAERAKVVKEDCSRFLRAIMDSQPPIDDLREPTEEEIAEFGVVAKVEDVGYPMLAVSMIFGKGRVEGVFELNAEAVGVTEADLKKIENGKYVRFYYTFEDRNNLHDIHVGGKSLFGEDAPDLDPEWKKITGTLKGAEEETAGDLPDEISVTDGSGNTVALDLFITPEIVAANGKKVSVYFDPHAVHAITLLQLPEE